MISRRDFFKTSMLGAGALAFNPSTSSLFAAPSSTGAPMRFIFIRKSSGLIPEHFALPSFSEADKKIDLQKGSLDVKLADHQLPTFMKPVESLRENMTILQGLSGKMMNVNGHHPHHSPLALVNSSGKPSDLIRVSLDFELAKLFPSPFTHIGFSAASHKSGVGPGYSIKSPGVENFEYLTPNAAFADIFGSVAQTKGGQADFKMQDEMLKFAARRQQRAANKNLSELEKWKINNYAMSTKELVDRNKKIEGMKDTLLKHVPNLDEKFMLNKISTSNKQTGHAKIAVAALISGLTNVVTIDMDSNHSFYDDLGLDGKSVHDIGHNKSVNNFTAKEARAIIQEHHMKVIALMADKLKQTPEGNGTMFDNTMICYLTDCGEKHHPTCVEWPFVVFTGKNVNLNMGGRYVRFPKHADEGHKTLGNFYTSILNAYGNPLSHYGPMDLGLEKLKFDQVGPIKEFLG